MSMYRHLTKKERKQLKKKIQSLVQNQELVYSNHALQRMKERNIHPSTVMETLLAPNMSLIDQYTVSFSKTSIRACVSSITPKSGRYPIHIVLHLENGRRLHVVTCYPADDTALYDEKGMPLEGLPADIVDLLMEELNDSLDYFRFLCAQPINLQGETMRCIRDVLQCFSYGLPLALDLLSALYPEAVRIMEAFSYDLAGLYGDVQWKEKLVEVFDNKNLAQENFTPIPEDEEIPEDVLKPKKHDEISLPKHNRLKLCFDVDDTLYDLAWPFYRAMRDFYPEVKGPKHDLEQMYQDYRGYGDDFFDLIQHGVITPDDSGILRILELAKNYDLNIDLMKALEFQEAYRAYQYSIRMNPAFYSFIAGLDADLALITNGNDRHQMKKVESLKMPAIIPYEKIFTSQALGYRKPDIRCFQTAFKKMGEDLSEWFYIGDSYDNDMEGAKNAGMKTIHFNRHRAKEGPASDFTVYNEQELMELIRTLQQHGLQQPERRLA